MRHRKFFQLTETLHNIVRCPRCHRRMRRYTRGPLMRPHPDSKYLLPDPSRSGYECPRCGWRQRYLTMNRNRHRDTYARLVRAGEKKMAKTYKELCAYRQGGYR